MNETVGWISGCITAVLLLAVLVGGISSCTVLEQQERTRRVSSVCGGDLNDATRAMACAMLMMDNGRTTNR